MATKQDVIAVVGQITNMLYNNVELGNGSEPFEGWCQDGEVFVDENVEARTEIMRTLAPFVDSLTNKIDELFD